ncbi:MAG: HIT domain-containing protein [Patescibacteria group bacterium]
MDCIFCKIVGKEISTEFAYEDDEMLAFKDIKPSAPVHYLLIPKEHIPSIAYVEVNNKDVVFKLILIAKKLAEGSGLKGYKLVFNVGREGGQIIDHLHLHLMGGWNNKTDIDAMSHPGLDK